MKDKILAFMIIVLTVGVIYFVASLNIDINGETIVNANDVIIDSGIEEIVVKRVYVPIVTPEAIKKESIESKPIYITTVDFECVDNDDDSELYPTHDEVYFLAKTVHGEASICSDKVKSQVAWCILNRVDDTSYPNTIEEVVKQPGQFQGFYRESSSEITDEELSMCYDIIKAWKNYDDRYRSLPSDYLYFRGDGYSNYFTKYFTSSIKEAKRNCYNGTMPSFWDEI